MLIPEGALRLQGPARRILELCDGQRTVAEIVAQLQSEFSAVDRARIADEVTIYLGQLHGRGVVEFLAAERVELP